MNVICDRNRKQVWSVVMEGISSVQQFVSNELNQVKKQRFETQVNPKERRQQGRGPDKIAKKGKG